MVTSETGVKLLIYNIGHSQDLLMKRKRTPVMTGRMIIFKLEL